MNDFCKMEFDHEPHETCKYCGLEVDKYGNTEEDFKNCCFPDCGCDGQRLCQAPSGANDDAVNGNVEGMYQRKDSAAVKAKMYLAGLVIKDEAKD